MAVDGSLNFDTGINTGGFEDGIEDVQEIANRLSRSMKDLSKDIENTFNGKASKVQGLANKIQLTEDKIRQLASEMDAVANTEFHTKEFEKLSTDIKKANTTLDELYDKRAELEASIRSGVADMGLPYSEDSLNRLVEENKEWSKLTGKISTAEQQLTGYEAKLKEIAAIENTSGINTSKYQKMQLQLDALLAQYQKYRAELQNTTQNEQNNASATKKAEKNIKTKTSAVNKANNSTKRYNKALAMLGKSLMFSMVFKAFNAVVNGIKEGMQNLAKYSTETNNTLSAFSTASLQLKNSLATAFSPILTAIAPAVTTLINILSNAITVMGQFFAVLFNGATTFTRAKKAQVDYGKSLKETGKQASKTLSPIDKLNNTTSNSGGGGGKAGMPNVKDMFQEVKVDNKMLDFVERFKEALQPTIDALERLKKALKPLKTFALQSLTDFYNKFLKPVGEWALGEGLPRLVDSLATLVSNIDFTKIGESLGKLFEALAPFTIEIGNGLLWLLENIIVPLSLIVINYGIPLLLDGITLAIQILNEAIAAAQPYLQWFFDNFLYPLTEWFANNENLGANTIEYLASTFLPLFQEIFGLMGNALSILWNDIVKPVFDFIIKVIMDLGDTLKEFWDKWGKPIFDSLTEAVKNMGELIKTVWEDQLKPVWDTFMETMDELWSNHLKPFIDNFMDLVGELVNGALQIFNKFITPLVKWFSKVLGPAIASVISHIIKETGDFLGSVVDVAGGIITVLKGIIKFIVGVFTGDWEKAFEGISDIFKGIWEGLSGIVKGVVNTIIGVINGMINGVTSGMNAVIRAINSINFTLPDWMGGYSVGLNLKEFKSPKIPKLATGTVVPSNYGEFLAILGDNKREAEVVSPLSTIKQALLEAMAESRGGGATEVHAHFYLNGKEIHEEVVRVENNKINDTGLSSFAIPAV